ncbi:long-chain-fatty-acid--CoA ligase ACSBG2-like [Daphnia pulicaria]|uniref:long-chain-fatty-acid--CoA ligase ACSBG2-like n=1 Tax=Daphnia pulicaria TaxID=35523 RepID=UPI001EEC9F47|nr:long-chain-fatty-acid--CoA ligase ACSBG2-like [Daphnia pulicaria]XP_046633357.1 long-chain-fatty-acid--CoA ligase ACSBG2-like [Daphnia pulicaria]XP_046633358.1 long-chain-fatty-acid--CoA ligase ACSBG2-like [Daphnia pulicaria]XP_046633359.1 long-chain-fatty-acid--CoA ligase ACSBG2-like [Daphnia pulicaria]
MSRHQQQQLSSMPSLTPSHDHHQLDAISSADLSLQQQPMSSVVEMTPRRKQAYGDVISEMNNKTSFESRRIHHEDPEIHTIVPSGDSKRVVLISSKSRGSDWDLTMVKDEQDSNNGVESEDSGFQLDADSSSIKIIAPAPVNDAAAAAAPADMTVTTQKSGTTVINITPPCKMEHRLLEHLHSTPLPSIVSAEVARDCPDLGKRRTSSVLEAKDSSKSVGEMRQQPKELNKGPDQLFPADSYTTTSATGAVKLKIDERGMASIPPLSVPTLLQRTVARHMDHPALCVKRDGKWIKWTYKQYLHDVRVCAKAFIRLGLERFHSVCILGFNSPEWIIADLAAIHAGGFAAGIYTTNSAEACLHCALNGQADIIVVEDRKQLEKILSIKDQIPTLKAIVQYTGKPHVEGVITWSQLMHLGNATPDNVYEDRLKKLAVNQCCTLIYTSGTTGPPKGVMLNHDNLTWISHNLATYMNLRDGKDTFLSYLPLSHVAAQITDIYAPLSVGGTVYFADPDVLKGTLAETLREVRPTCFFGVPRVWEKIYEKMQAIGKQTTGIKKTIATWSKSVGLSYNRRRMEGRSSKPFGFALANALVFKKVREGLGLDKARVILSGAAPLSKEVAEYFTSLDIPILEVYGMSESTGPHSINNITKGYQLNSAGKSVPGCLTKIANPDKDGNGEILMGGRHVFMGYLNDPGNTSSVVDADGYLSTGDVGHTDKFGFVYITGRIKEILITAGGENVAPVLIEDNIKAELPIVSHAMVVGDRRKFLSILLTLRTEVDPDTQEPLPILTRPTRDICESYGLSLAETVTDVICAAERGMAERDPMAALTGQDAEAVKFVKVIDAAIERANRNAISAAQRVQKWTILPVDFSIPGGELGPTMKMKRSCVAKKYADVIERFYY